VKQIDSEKKLDRLKLYKLLETIYSDNTTEEINFISSQLLQILDNFSEKSAFEEIKNICINLQKDTDASNSELKNLLKLIINEWEDKEEQKTGFGFR